MQMQFKVTMVMRSMNAPQNENKVSPDKSNPSFTFNMAR